MYSKKAISKNFPLLMEFYFGNLHFCRLHYSKRKKFCQMKIKIQISKHGGDYERS